MISKAKLYPKTNKLTPAIGREAGRQAEKASSQGCYPSLGFDDNAKAVGPNLNSLLSLLKPSRKLSIELCRDHNLLLEEIGN